MGQYRELPLLPQQKKFVSYELKEESKGSQNAGIVIELKGAIDRKRLEKALTQVAEEYDALHYMLKRNLHGEILQVYSQNAIVWEKVDCRNYPQEQRKETVLAMAKVENEKAMDLFEEAMAKFFMYELAEDWVCLYIKINHVIIDGPSFRAIYTRLYQYYYGKDVKKSITWSIFVDDEMRALKSAEGKNSCLHWKSIENKMPIEVSLTDIKNVELILEKKAADNKISKYMLDKLARKNKTSPFQLLLFAYNMALARVFDRNAFAVSYTITDRFEEEKRYMAGLTTHSCSHILWDIHQKKLNQMLAESKRQVTEGFKYYIASECIGLPVFSISYLTETIKMPEWEGLEIKHYPLQGKRNQHDLSYMLMCTEIEDMVEFSVVADEEIYCEAFSQKLIDFMKEVLGELEMENKQEHIEKIPLTLTQKSYVAREYPSNPGFLNMTSGFVLKGAYDLERLDSAVRKLYSRHDGMRMVLHKDGAKDFYMTVENSICNGIIVCDLKSTRCEERYEEAMRDLDEKIKQTLLFSTDGMYRFWAYEVSDNELIVFYMANHLVIDGGAMAVIDNELALLYENPEREDLPEAGSFRTYLLEKEAVHNSSAGKEQEKYWLKKMEGYTEPELVKNTGETSEKVKTMEAAAVQFDSAVISKIARKCRTSNFNIMFILWQLAVTRQARQNDIGFQYAFASRFKEEYQNTVGLLAQGVPVRARFQMESSWKDVVKEYRNTMNEDIKMVETSDIIPEQEYIMSYIPYNGIKEKKNFGTLELRTFSKVDNYYNGRFFCALVAEFEKQIVMYPYCDSNLYGMDYVFGINEKMQNYMQKLEENIDITLRELCKEKEETIQNGESRVRSVLAESWKTVLELEEEPQNTDDFFDLGGNSYKAFFIIKNLPEEFQGKLEMSDFYDCESFEEMVQVIEERVEK